MRTLGTKMVVASLTVGLVLALGGSVWAGPLGLTPTEPNVHSECVYVQYDVSSLSFHVEGWAESVTLPGGTYIDLTSEWARFLLDVTIDSSSGEAIATDGSLLVTRGTEESQETLFQSSNVIAFGSCETDMFEFQFIQEGTTSIAADEDVIGVILDGRGVTQIPSGEGFPDGVPVFTSSFENTWNGGADTFVMQQGTTAVPEPGTLGLVVLGGLALIGRRRRAA